MDNCLTVKEAIEYLKDKVVLTTNNGDYFSFVGEFIHYKFNGSSISLTVDDFLKLFKESKFFPVEDNSFVIDELKDKEYYEKYKK